MVNFDKLLIDRLLQERGLFRRAEKMIQQFADSGDVNEKVSETAGELKTRWGTKDAERVLGYSGVEVWVSLRPLH